jgi:hypothetical protein
VGAAALVAATVGSVLADPLDLVGASDPGTPGFNAMAVGLNGIAYLGSWGGRSQCPSLGVRLFDIHDPTAPRPLGNAAAYQGTTAEHVAAVHLETPAFIGDVLFAGIQRCQVSSATPSGLAIWNVTDPSNPTELAFFQTGGRALGVHEFTIREQGDHWLAYLAVPNAEVADHTGDLRIVDVSDPRNPVQLTDWGARRDAGLPVGVQDQCTPLCRGASPDAYLHSVALSPDARTAYLSYWDLGVIILDVSEPAAPRWIGRFAEPLSDEGNTHSVALTRDGKLMLVADETFGPPWGGLRIVDVTDPSIPVQVGTFETADATLGRHGDVYQYSVHNPLADDRDPTRAYVAWYGDGIRLLDITDPSHAVEAAAWIPPNTGMIWNVSFFGDLLLAGDITNGLWIFRR